jgi:hypothetical protein
MAVQKITENPPYTNYNQYIRSLYMGENMNPTLKRYKEIAGQEGIGIKRDDGKYSTHSMEVSEFDGKSYAYPTVFRNPDGTYQERGDALEAFTMAKELGEAIPFNTSEDALKFTENYKDYFDLLNVSNIQNKDIIPNKEEVIDNSLDGFPLNQNMPQVPFTDKTIGQTEEDIIEEISPEEDAIVPEIMSPIEATEIPLEDTLADQDILPSPKIDTEDSDEDDELEDEVHGVVEDEYDSEEE